MTSASHQLTPNQIVASNLARARALRGWTQQEAGSHLAPYLGVTWSRASWSAAEASAKPGKTRIKQFSVDELVAFSLAFGLPIGFFLVPPGGTEIAAGTAPLSPASLLDRLLPDAALLQRVREFLAEASAEIRNAYGPLLAGYERPSLSATPLAPGVREAVELLVQRMLENVSQGEAGGEQETTNG